MEQEAAHTPGPWRATSRNIENVANWASRIPFAIEIEVGHSVAPIADVCDQPAAEANARLIAAGPDLLAACKSMIEWDDREKDHAVDFSARMALCDAAFKAARAAIAKAEGGAA